MHIQYKVELYNGELYKKLYTVPCCCRRFDSQQPQTVSLLISFLNEKERGEEGRRGEERGEEGSSV